MLPELGQICLILALLLSLTLAVCPLIGASNGQLALQQLARPLSYGIAAFIALAFALLVSAFITQDFSVAYVARNSNSLLPLQYRISAVWGAHEGSLLLWSLILTLWTAAVATFSRSLPRDYVARVLAILGWIIAGFLLFILFTSNPFDRLLPAALDGADLNPLLQDPGLIIHPPMLYCGYVGFAVPYAFAVAALMSGKVNRDWVRWCRPWALVAWALLTAGIALGSWWAYYELGWGGWWFWDPVENASFMPWLVGTALLHSLAVTEKRQAFTNWTLLLSIMAFSLSLLGTFLVRSGVLTSVHAFASDPERGIFILALLGVLCGGALVLFAFRAHTIQQETRIGNWSREVLLLINNVFFAASAGMVLLGTLYPLLVEAMGGGKISVGPPYFGLLFSLLMIPVVILMPFGPLSRWQKDSFSTVFRKLMPVLGLAILLGVIAGATLGNWHWRAIIGVSGALWLMFGSVYYIIKRLGQSAPLGRWEYGMACAHFGVGVFVVGVALVGAQELQRDMRMGAGDELELAGYRVEFDGTRTVQGPNYISQQGVFRISKNDEQIAVLEPEKRRYHATGSIMTEAAIDRGFTRDLYIALGEPLAPEGATEEIPNSPAGGPSQVSGDWSVRVYVKPFVRWIWSGALFILFGAILAASDRRYRRKNQHVKTTVSDNQLSRPDRVADYRPEAL